MSFGSDLHELVGLKKVWILKNLLLCFDLKLTGNLKQ